jgi:hypothetical protein
VWCAFGGGGGSWLKCVYLVMIWRRLGVAIDDPNVLFRGCFSVGAVVILLKELGLRVCYWLPDVST